MNGKPPGRRAAASFCAAGLVVTACGLAAGCSAAVAPTATGRPTAEREAVAPFVYVADKSRNVVSQFGTSARGSGALRPLAPKAVASGPVPVLVAVSRQGNSVYVADAGTFSAPVNKISQYTVNPATGKLTPKSPATVTTGAEPIAIAIAPDGKSAYVADGAAHAISQYAISPATGRLTAKSPATVAVAGIPSWITVAPDGKYAYVLNFSRHLVAQYRIDRATGALADRPVATVATRGLESITVAPDGKSAYTTDPTGGRIWQYRISPATGNLIPDSPPSVATGRGTHDIEITPNGKDAYVLTVVNNKISQYRIDPVTGGFSSKPVSTAATVLHPETMVISPDGQNAYVTSENKGALSQFAISPATGKITPLSPPAVPVESGSLGLAITPAADLSAKGSAPATARTGSALTYSITISDAGPSQAWQAAVTDQLPAGTALRTVTTSGGRCTAPRAGTRGATIKCILAELKAGGVWRIHIKVIVKASTGTMRDRAAVTGVTPDPSPRGNTTVIATKIAR